MKPERQPQPLRPAGGNLLIDLLTLPILGTPRMVHWVARKLAETAEHELRDEGKLQGDLLALQIQYDLGEINDEEYTEQETAILERLNAIRQANEEE